MDILHDAGCVFGDIREPDILRLKSGGVMLADFDWSARHGREGVLSNPMGLNTEIDCPSGSGVGKPIVKSHGHDKFKLK